MGAFSHYNGSMNFIKYVCLRLRRTALRKSLVQRPIATSTCAPYTEHERGFAGSALHVDLPQKSTFKPHEIIMSSFLVELLYTLLLLAMASLVKVDDQPATQGTTTCSSSEIASEALNELQPHVNR